MKITSLLFTALLLASAGLQAEDKPAAGDPPAKPERPGRGPGGPGGRGSFNPEERLKMMTEKLGLTQEQQDKIKAIFEKNAEEMKALMAKGRENLTEEDRKKMGDLMKTQREAIDAVLTDEQKAKMKEMRPAGPGGPGGPGRGGKGGEGGRGRGPGGPPPPDGAPKPEPETK